MPGSSSTRTADPRYIFLEFSYETIGEEHFIVPQQNILRLG
jgi:hypothetical protein